MSSPVPETAPPSRSWLGPALRVLVFALVAVFGQLIFSFVLQPFGLLIAATLAVFGGSAVASAVALRIYEAGRLISIGFNWHGSAGRHAAFGVLGGAAGAAFAAGFPVLAGKAEIVAAPEAPFNAGSLFLVMILLLFGAIGEELLFRGYAFQILAGHFGTYRILLPVSVLFAAAHMGNIEANPLGLFNTFLWGVLLGWGLLRAGDLWLPIGLHFGWNATLPLFGANLSGFTMGLTGYKLEWKAGPLWSGGGYGPEGSLVTTVAVLGVAYLLYRLPIERQRLPLLPEED